MTLVCGTAGFDGTQFKGILANRLQTSSQQDLAQLGPAQSNINNTRSDVAHLIRVLAEISGEIDARSERRAARMRARRSTRGSRA